MDTFALKLVEDTNIHVICSYLSCICMPLLRVLSPKIIYYHIFDVLYINLGFDLI